MADSSERIVELTRELMSKGMLIDQLSDQITELQGALTSMPTPSSPTSAASSILHHKTHLINSLSHSLLTTKRVLDLERGGLGSIRSSLNSFNEGFGADMKSLVGVMGQVSAAGARERSAAAAELSASEKRRAAVEAENESLSKKLASLMESNFSSMEVAGKLQVRELVVPRPPAHPLTRLLTHSPTHP
jgi:hypothetical protein